MAILLFCKRKSSRLELGGIEQHIHSVPWYAHPYADTDMHKTAHPGTIEIIDYVLYFNLFCRLKV